jgi:hypothetical protein
MMVEDLAYQMAGLLDVMKAWMWEPALAPLQ